MTLPRVRQKEVNVVVPCSTPLGSLEAPSAAFFLLLAPPLVEAYTHRFQCRITVPRAALPHGEFESMVESEEVPFGTRTAQRLMAIAEHSILSKRAHVHVLPPAWGTVYELTKAPDQAIRLWLTDGTIHPILEMFSVAGSLVCDPFCGAGATGMAALPTCRAALGRSVFEVVVLLEEGPRR